MADAAKQNASFLRVANAHLLGVGKADHTFASLRELGLYMMLSSVLSNPSFTYAAGGMQHLLQLHCKNKYFSLHATWRTLSKKGFFKRTRIPCGTNCFHDYYTLSDDGAFTADRAEHLSAKEGKDFIGAYTPYLPPHTDFTMVSREMLMDARLSLAAKGLFALLSRQLRLAAQCSPEHKPEISKRALRALCAEGKNAFDGLFRELRMTGYLALLRNHEGGKLSYIYKLCDTPLAQNTEKAPQTRPKTAPHATLRAATAMPMAQKEQAAPLAQRIAPRSLESAARAQIEYNILLCDYPKSRLDLIVSIIASAHAHGQKDPQRAVSLGREGTTASLLSEKLSALDSEDIRYVLETLSETEKTTKIHHLRRYMTTCLYFAKENLALALDSFSFPKTVPRSAFSV